MTCDLTNGVRRQIKALLYDPRANYDAGDLVYVVHPVYGASLARVTQRIEVSGAAKVEFDFSDNEFEAKWRSLRHTPFWAVNVGNRRVRPPYVSVRPDGDCIAKKARKHTLPATEQAAHPQGIYQHLILRAVRPNGQITVEELKASVGERLVLSAADWQLRRSNASKVIWLERLHGAIHNLVRRGLLIQCGRGVYRRRSA
jgi:hypothetical protein